MTKVFLLHWNKAECEALASPLRRAGHDVVLHWSTETGPPLKDALPDVAVIFLDRLPSHGRAVAEWLWEAKKRQHIPIVFAGGEQAKVQATREKFPKAHFCSPDALLTAIDRVLLARPPARPSRRQGESTAGSVPSRAGKRGARRDSSSRRTAPPE